MGIRESIELAIDQRRQKAEAKRHETLVASVNKVRALEKRGELSPELAEKWIDRANDTYEGGGSLAPLGGKIVGLAKGFQQGLGNMGTNLMEGESQPRPRGRRGGGIPRAPPGVMSMGMGGGGMPSWDNLGNPWGPSKAPKKKKSSKSSGKSVHIHIHK